jgi:hypothetical protein
MNASLPPSTPETLRSALARAAGDLAKQSSPSSGHAGRLPGSLLEVIDARGLSVSAAPPASASASAASESASASASATSLKRRFAWAGGGLAALTLSSAIALLVIAPRDDMPTARAELATAFMPVGDAQRWPQLMRDAAEPGRAWVVPTELPSESLAAMGLPYDPAHAGEPVRAELLVHANGDVLAVRFVR